MSKETLSGCRILLVEDEMMIAIELEDMLGALGCHVVASAARAAQAIAVIESEKLDAAILDVNLDGQHSYAVATELAERSVPFIFSTGYQYPGAQEGFGDRPVLKKPFSRTDLAQALVGLLAKAG